MYIYISFQTLISSSMYGLLNDGKGIAETPVFVKDTVSYETGEWKYLKPFLFFISLSAN